MYLLYTANVEVKYLSIDNHGVKVEVRINCDNISTQVIRTFEPLFTNHLNINENVIRMCETIGHTRSKLSIQSLFQMFVDNCDKTIIIIKRRG